MISFKRKAIDKSELLIVVNFSPITRENYTVKLEESGKYEELIEKDGLYKSLYALQFRDNDFIA